MADISDVEMAMVSEAAGFLSLGKHYLAGSAVMSPTAEQRCRVYRGWPVSAALDRDMVDGITSVTVFPVAGATRRTTKYLPQWHEGPTVTPTLTATVSGATVTLGGRPDVGQVVGVRIGPFINPAAYAYRLGRGETLPSVAASLAALIPGATAARNVITLPVSTGVVARVGADQPAWQETRRQAQNVWVITWAPNPAARDAVASIVDAGFANMTDAFGNLTYFMPLPDGSSADLRYFSSHTIDQTQKANLWRRDLRYVVEYPTTLLEQQPTLLFPTTTFDASVTIEIAT
jgi:hypothetical protein